MSGCCYCGACLCDVEGLTDEQREHADKLVVGLITERDELRAEAERLRVLLERLYVLAVGTDQCAEEAKILDDVWRELAKLCPVCDDRGDQE